MGDQYLCLDQLKVDGKVPPPPPSKVAAPVPAQKPVVPPMVPPPPPPPAPKINKAPPPPPSLAASPKPHRKDKTKSKSSPVSKLRSDRSEVTPRGIRKKEKGRRPLVRILIAVSNVLFLIVFVLWILTLLTGLHMVEISFIEKMFEL